MIASAAELTGQIKLMGGSPGAGKILTSDATGLASWSAVSSVASGTLDQAYDFGGLGIGRTISATSGALKIQGTDGLLVTGTFSSGAGLEVSGAGSRMFFNPKKAAFRAGQVTGTGWDEGSVGENSVGLGYNSIASGFGSVSLGYGATAINLFAVAAGPNAAATGEASLALGYEPTASGGLSVAIGDTPEAFGASSVAIGSRVKAKSFAETALGIFNTDYTPLGGSATFELTDRLLVVGNGTSVSTRSNAMVMLKNGNTAFGNANPTANLEVVGSGERTVRVTSTGSSAVQVDLKRTGSDWQMRNSGGLLFFGQSSDDLATVSDVLRLGGSTVTPAIDNSVQSGSSSLRWNLIFATSGVVSTSDAREKTNIKNIDYGIDEIMKLRPVQFNWKSNPNDDGTKLGLIAQELQQVMPEVVRDWDWKYDEDGGGAPAKVPAQRLGVFYSDLIPVLIKGMQEQQELIAPVGEEIEQMNAMIASLQSENQSIRSENAAIRSQLDAILDRLDNFDGDLQQCCLSHSDNNNIPNGTQPTGDQPSLGQNIPNPFDGSTLISYYLPQGTAQAQLVVADRSGVQVANFALNQSGFGQVRLDGSRLAAGVYVYSLTMEGRLIETKQMVIAH